MSLTSTTVNTWRWDFPGMVCLGRMRGQSEFSSSSKRVLIVASLSAQVVADMIVSDITGNVWSPPEWLPRHYVTGKIGRV